MKPSQSAFLSFQLRPWKITDLDSLVRYANNKNVSDWLTDAFPFPYTHEHGRNFILSVQEHSHRAVVFAIDINGEAAGGIGVYPKDDIFHFNAELGYWLAEPFWGHGIVTSAVKQMVDFAFNRFSVDRVFARPFGNNLPSQRVLEKTGFKLEARFDKIICKNNQLIDELIYGIRRDQWIKKS